MPPLSTATLVPPRQPSLAFAPLSVQRPPQGRRSAAAAIPELPVSVAATVWRGDQIGAPAAPVLPSGFATLDAVLPGGGWPGRAVTEILAAHAGSLEWRLLGPALRQVCAAGGRVAVVGPPQPPHLPGLRFEGITERHLIWVQADTPAERLWSTEQLVKARRACGAIVAWLPQARPAQVRRLQVLAAGCEGPVFLCRPAWLAERESSAAPLRLRARTGPDWTLQVDVIKRKGPPLDAPLHLFSVPGGLQAVLTPRLRHPSRLLPPLRETGGVTAPSSHPDPHQHHAVVGSAVAAHTLSDDRRSQRFPHRSH